MTDINKLITEQIDIWSCAVERKTTTGRGASKKLELTGINKLKELILELAIQGKLLPQNPKEQANTLLESIDIQRANLIKEKVIKRPKKFPEISNDEIPFEIPSNWAWLRIADIGHDWGQKKPENEFSYVDVGSINKEYGFIQSPLTLPASEAPSRARKIVKKGTVLYSTVRPYLLNIAVVDIDFEPEPIASTAFAIVHPFEGVNASYIYRYLRSPSFIKYVESCQTGVAYPAVNDKQFFSGVIPIPPVEEQNRLVKKIDELFELCDQLEQQTEASIDAHQLLVEELLSMLTNSENSQEFEQNWARIAEHFDLLFTTENSIEQLKQTILQLAVMGKLVPQDPNDEHVDILLERISAHRDERVKAKEIQKPKKVNVENTPSFQIPKSWENVLLNDLVFVTKLAGFEYTKYINLEDSGEIPVIRAQNVRPFLPDLTNLKYIDEETSLALPRSALDQKCLLVTFIGAGIGDVCVLENDVRRHLAPNVAKVEAFSNFDLDYLCLYLNSPNGRSELFKSIKSTAQPSLSMTTIREIWVSIPPIEEQKRIVLKTQILLELCEKLKFSISSASMTKVNLAKEIVEKALG